MIIGIDPSFTSTGIAVTSDSGEFLRSTSFKSGIKIYESITACQDAAEVITSATISYISYCIKVLKEHNSSVVIVVEYPALATRSGAYLAVLHGYLASALNKLSDMSKQQIKVVYVPPTACNSFTLNKTKTKSYLVNFCRQCGWIDRRLNNDICTAVIFCHLWIAIQEHSYKHSYFLHSVGE